MIPFGLALFVACSQPSGAPPVSEPTAEWWKGESGSCGEPLTRRNIGPSPDSAACRAGVGDPGPAAPGNCE